MPGWGKPGGKDYQGRGMLGDENRGTGGERRNRVNAEKAENHDRGKKELRTGNMKTM